MSLEEYYSNGVVYKSIIITNDDEDCYIVRDMLENMDVATRCITLDHVDDDRPLHMNTVRMYVSGMIRAICISFNAWLRIKSDIELYAMDHNLAYLYYLEPEYLRMCVNWLNDCKQRGLRMRAVNYYIGVC